MKLRNFLTLVFFALSPLSVSASEAIPYDLKNQLVEALQKLALLENDFVTAVDTPVKSTFHPLGIQLKKDNNKEDLTTAIKATLRGLMGSVSSQSTDKKLIEGWKSLQSDQKRFFQAVIQKVTSLWEAKNTKQYKGKIQDDLTELQNLNTQLQGMEQHSDFTLDNIKAYHTLIETAGQRYESAVVHFKS